jgi:hypothetical protein
MPRAGSHACSSALNGSIWLPSLVPAPAGIGGKSNDRFLLDCLFACNSGPLVQGIISGKTARRGAPSWYTLLVPFVQLAAFELEQKGQVENRQPYRAIIPATGLV